MPPWLEPYLTSSNPYFYPIFSGSLILAANGFPISADLVLLTVSYLIYTNNASFFPSLIAALIGITIGDSIMFFIATYYGEKLIKSWPFNTFISNESLDKAKASYHKVGYKMIFFARFMPGIRTLFVFTSGLLKLNYFKFIFANTMGLLIVYPLMLNSIRFFAGNKESMFQFLQKFQWLALGILITIKMIVVFYFRKSNQNKISK